MNLQARKLDWVIDDRGPFGYPEPGTVRAWSVQARGDPVAFKSEQELCDVLEALRSRDTCLNVALVVLSTDVTDAGSNDALDTRMCSYHEDPGGADQPRREHDVPPRIQPSCAEATITEQGGVLTCAICLKIGWIQPHSEEGLLLNDGEVLGSKYLCKTCINRTWRLEAFEVSFRRGGSDLRIITFAARYQSRVRYRAVTMALSIADALLGSAFALPKVDDSLPKSLLRFTDVLDDDFLTRVLKAPYDKFSTAYVAAIASVERERKVKTINRDKQQLLILHGADAVEVCRGLYWASSAVAFNPKTLGVLQIDAVLKFGDEYDVPRLQGIPLRITEIAIEDQRYEANKMASVIPLVVAWMAVAQAAGVNVMVTCNKGASRSAVAVAAYQIWRRGSSWGDTLRELESVRPCCSPNLGFMGLLSQWSDVIQRVRPAVWRICENLGTLDWLVYCPFEGEVGWVTTVKESNVYWIVMDCLAWVVIPKLREVLCTTCDTMEASIPPLPKIFGHSKGELCCKTEFSISSDREGLSLEFRGNKVNLNFM